MSLTYEDHIGDPLTIISKYVCSFINFILTNYGHVLGHRFLYLFLFARFDFFSISVF